MEMHGGLAPTIGVRSEINQGVTMLNRISKSYRSHKGQILSRIAGIGLLAVLTTGLASNLNAQGCDCNSANHKACGCGVVHSGHGSHCHHHHNCQAIGLLDRLDAFSNRMEAKLDGVFGRLTLPGTKKHCHCGRCSQAAHTTANGDVGAEMSYEPEDPAIADPNLSDSAEPIHDQAGASGDEASGDEPGDLQIDNSHSATQGGKSKSSTQLKRLVPMPPPVVSGNKEIPTSIDASGRRSRTDTQNKSNLDITPDAKPQGTNPKVRVPDWLNDPFKDDTTSRSKADQPAVEGSSDGIRWTKRKTDDRTSSTSEPLKIRGVVDAASGFKKLVWRGDESAENREAVQASAAEEDPESVVRAAVSDPAQSTKPKWKEAELPKQATGVTAPKATSSIFNFRR